MMLKQMFEWILKSIWWSIDTVLLDHSGSKPWYDSEEQFPSCLPGLSSCVNKAES